MGRYRLKYDGKYNRTYKAINAKSDRERRKLCQMIYIIIHILINTIYVLYISSLLYVIIEIIFLKIF